MGYTPKYQRPTRKRMAIHDKQRKIFFKDKFGKKINGTQHMWELCPMCGPMVICGICGNNCCNGGSGSGYKDIDCDCHEAYDLQHQGYMEFSKRYPHKITKSEREYNQKCDRWNKETDEVKIKKRMDALMRRLEKIHKAKRDKKENV